MGDERTQANALLKKVAKFHLRSCRYLLPMACVKAVSLRSDGYPGYTCTFLKITLVVHPLNAVDGSNTSEIQGISRKLSSTTGPFRASGPNGRIDFSESPIIGRHVMFLSEIRAQLKPQTCTNPSQHARSCLTRTAPVSLPISVTCFRRRYSVCRLRRAAEMHPRMYLRSKYDC